VATGTYPTASGITDGGVDSTAVTTTGTPPEESGNDGASVERDGASGSAGSDAASAGSDAAADGDDAASDGNDAASDGNEGQTSCSADASLCQGVCTDTQSDPLNCGGCSIPCFGICEGGPCGCVAGSCECTTDEDCYGTVCVGGVCICPTGESLCGQSCADLQTDPDNCGACTIECDPRVRSCQSGACTCLDGTSACTLTQLAGNLDQPQNIAVAGEYVYFAASTSVYKVPIDGGTPVVIASEQGSPAGVAVDGTGVYWVDTGTTGTVMAAPLDGGAAFALASGQNSPNGTVVAGGNVYWVTSSGSTGAIMTVPTAGGTPTPFANVQATTIAVDANNVYACVQLPQPTDGALVMESSQIVRMPLDGGAATVLASQMGGTSIAVDAVNVYWVSGEPPGIGVIAVAIDGGVPVTLAAETQAHSLVSDGTNLYYAVLTATPSDVMRVPVTGGTAVVVAAQQNNPGAVAVDGTSLYWMNAGGAMGFPNNELGSLMKVTPK
jgi:hypothetical protein